MILQTTTKLFFYKVITKTCCKSHNYSWKDREKCWPPLLGSQPKQTKLNSFKFLISNDGLEWTGIYVNYNCNRLIRNIQRGNMSAEKNNFTTAINHLKCKKLLILYLNHCTWTFSNANVVILKNKCKKVFLLIKSN